MVFEVVQKEQVEAGDLLLVTKIPDEPLGGLMHELDGTAFSHSGIALGDGMIASSHATMLPAGGNDPGGIRHDRFANFWPHRDIYRIPMNAEHRAQALDYVGTFAQRPREEGSFGFTKLFNVAVALHATALHRAGDVDGGDALLAAATATARAWAATPERPRYYCAELVATAYGRPFRRAELEPPLIAVTGGGPVEADIAALFQIVAEDWPGTSAESDTLIALVGALLGHDRGFLRRAASTVAAAAEFARASQRSHPDRRAPDDRPPDVPDPLPEPDPDVDLGPVLPYALVTPRMLWQAFGRTSLQKIEQRVTVDPGAG